MNLSNIIIDDKSTETNGKTTCYVSRSNPKIPWPSNVSLVQFVSNGKYNKYKMLTTGHPNVKVIVFK